MNQLCNKPLLSKSSTNALRVIFELMVLFHHLYVASTAWGDRIDILFGPVAVGGFFLLSGYGVGFSFLNKGDEYCKKLLKNRIPKTYLIILIADLVYLGLYYYMGNSFENFFDLAISVLYLPVFSGFVALSHYIYFLADLIIYYFMFLIFVRIFKKAKNPLFSTALAIVLVDLVIIAVLTVINAETGSNRHLRACVCFPLGLLLACTLKEKNVVEWLKKFKWVLAISLIAVGSVIYALTNDVSILEYLLPILFAFAMIALFFGVDFKNKIIDYASQAVVYVYVSHEFFRELLDYKIAGDMTNEIALMVLFVSLVVGFVMLGIEKKANMQNKKKLA